jgi:hypothetical protein
MDEAPRKPQPRVRNIDWLQVIQQLEQLPAGQAVYIGVLDQSVRTQINQGRYSYIDPDMYRAYTKAALDLGPTKAHIYLYRRADAPSK